MSIKIFLYYLIITSATITGLIQYSKLFKNFKLLTLILLITSLTELVAFYLTNILKNPNTPIYHIFQLIEYLLIASIYKIEINNKSVKSYLTISTIVYPIIMVLITLFVQPLNVYPSYSLMLSYGSVFIYTLIKYYEYVIAEEEFFKIPFFGLNTLFFLLCSVSFFTLSLTNLFKIKIPANSIIYTIHIGINYIFYLGCWFILAFSKSSKLHERRT